MEARGIEFCPTPGGPVAIGANPAESLTSPAPAHQRTPVPHRMETPSVGTKKPHLTLGVVPLTHALNL